MLPPSNGQPTTHRREAHWRRHILAQRASQLGILEYCRRHALHSPSFFVWRKRLGLKASADTCPAVRTSPVSPARTAATPLFVAVDLPAPTLTSALTLHLPGERRLDIADHCNATLLRTVLAVLEGQSC